MLHQSEARLDNSCYSVMQLSIWHLPSLASICLLGYSAQGTTCSLFPDTKMGRGIWDGSLNKEHCSELFWDLKTWKGGRSVWIEPGSCGWLHDFVKVEDPEGQEIASLFCPRPSPGLGRQMPIGQALAIMLSLLDTGGKNLSHEADSSHLSLCRSVQKRECLGKSWRMFWDPQEILHHPGSYIPSFLHHCRPVSRLAAAAGSETCSIQEQFLGRFPDHCLRSVCSSCRAVCLLV